MGRYYVQKSALLGMSLMPAVSFKATDWLSVGAGLNAMYGYLDSKWPSRTGAAGDGQMKLKDETWGFGANAGVMIEPREGTRIGVTYLSPVKLDFKDTPPSATWAARRRPARQPAPIEPGHDRAAVGDARRLPRLECQMGLMADVGWQNWSQFGEVEVGVEPAGASRAVTANLNYQDTWHGALGAQYRASETMAVLRRRRLRQLGGERRQPHLSAAHGPGLSASALARNGR